MIHTIIFMFFAGIFALNLVPHLTKSLVREPFPTPFGSTPAANFLGSWMMLLATVGLVWGSDVRKHQLAAFIAASLGSLAIGLFHSLHGAFGKK